MEFRSLTGNNFFYSVLSTIQICFALQYNINYLRTEEKYLNTSTTEYNIMPNAILYECSSRNAP